MNDFVHDTAPLNTFLNVALCCIMLYCVTLCCNIFGATFILILIVWQ